MEIGPKPFIIAEMSGNHNGSFLAATRLIEAAAKCGCDAVKMQLYKPEDLDDPANNEIYEKYKTPPEWLRWLFETARECRIPLFFSVFATWAIDQLEINKCPAYKLASPESTRLTPERYHELNTALRKTGKPIIASTGERDRDLIESLWSDYVLFCKAGYPATITPSELANLWQFDGFSDHTEGILAPCAALWTGAKIIEKHFKLNDDCVDAAFSINPQQMKLLCDIAHG